MDVDAPSGADADEGRDSVRSSLARHARYWRWSASAQLTRLPIAMAPLAFTAATSASLGSYATGAAIVSAIVIAEVTSAVPIGRLFDRIGIARGLRILLVVRGVAYLGLLLALFGGSPRVLLVLLAVLIGVLGGGLLGSQRAQLLGVVGPALLNRAVAVNAIVVDGVIVGGPLLVGALSRLSTTAPVLVMAAASILAAPLVVPDRGEVHARPPAAGGALLVPLIGWVCSAFAVGHLASAIEVAVLPIAERLGEGTGAASLIVVVLSVTSVLGGLVYLRLDRPGSPRAAAVLLTVFAAGVVVVTVGATWPAVLAGTALAGACIGPLSTINSLLAEGVLPEQRKAEGFALLNTAQGLGFGLGSLSVSVLPLEAVGLAGAASGLVAAAVVIGRAPRRSAGTLPPAAG